MDIHKVVIDQRPKVGIGMMVLNDKGEVLLGHRNDDPIKASSDLHGESCWTMPGGKLDFGETLLDGAIRELLEETGIKANKSKTELISLTNEIRPDTHYVTAGFLCSNFSAQGGPASGWEGELKAMEPEEITEWKWYNLNNLPENIFLPSAKVIKNYLNKSIYNN
jgi:8-oxo-dGTP diphosphatase